MSSTSTAADPRMNGRNTGLWVAASVGTLFSLVFTLYAVSDSPDQIAANDRAVQQTLPTTVDRAFEGGTSPSRHNR